MKKEIRVYVKKDKRYWYGDHYFDNIGYGILVMFILLMIIALVVNSINSKPLVSPVVSNIVSPIYAKEPEVKISCEDPKGYLACKAYNKDITWEQHDRISKIINCESRWNPDAMNVNKNGSVDLGLVQINSVHKNISNADKLDFKKAIDWMIAKIKRDGGYGAWTCNRIIK